MTRKIQSGILGLAIAVGGLFAGSPAQAARPLQRHPSRAAYSARSQARWYGSGYGVSNYGWGYGFAPYVYYNTYGFGGITGAPNDSPLRYGYGNTAYGSSGYALDAADLGFWSD